jgi:hypothetical protein
MLCPPAKHTRDAPWFARSEMETRHVTWRLHTRCRSNHRLSKGGSIVNGGQSPQSASPQHTACHSGGERRLWKATNVDERIGEATIRRADAVKVASVKWTFASNHHAVRPSSSTPTSSAMRSSHVRWAATARAERNGQKSEPRHRFLDFGAVDTILADPEAA